MLSRDVIKINVPNSYHHMSVRGVNQQPIFIDEADYRFFLSLFERYLSKETMSNQEHIENQKINDSVEVLAYCLMPDHFHLLLYQIDEDGIHRLMYNIVTNYDQYFNKKYHHSGSIFENQHETVHILSNDHLLHMSRHVHLSPDEWIDYPHSSLRAYLYDDAPTWLRKNRIAELSGSAIKYLDFLNDSYEDATSL